MFENYPDVLTVYELAEILRINRTTAYGLINSDVVKHVRIGTTYRVSKKSVIQYLNGESHKSNSH